MVDLVTRGTSAGSSVSGTEVYLELQFVEKEKPGRLVVFPHPHYK
jgi:hypothetical protein